MSTSWCMTLKFIPTQEVWHEVLMKGHIKRARSDLNRGWSSQECTEVMELS